METRTESPNDDGIQIASRGIGRDWTHGCFICGGDASGIYNNISAFVKSKESGEKVVSMFERGAKLDYRPSEPNWIQVKIGACDGHLGNLLKLNTFTQAEGIITKAMVAAAMS